MKIFYTFFLLAFNGIIAQAQYSKLLEFNITNGSVPKGSLITDGTFLYGMTYGGGLNYDGVIFKIKPDGTEFTTLFNFEAVQTGQNPAASLFSDGTYFYGMTEGGGSNNYTTWGTFFKIMPDGTGFEKLFTFSGANGKYPRSTPVSDGTYLYATTSSGGANNYGTILK